MGIRLYHIDTPIGVRWWLVGGTIGSGADGEALAELGFFQNPTLTPCAVCRREAALQGDQESLRNVGNEGCDEGCDEVM